MTSSALGSAEKRSVCKNSQAFSGWVTDTLETEKEERTWLDFLPEKKKVSKRHSFLLPLGKERISQTV